MSHEVPPGVLLERLDGLRDKLESGFRHLQEGIDAMGSNVEEVRESAKENAAEIVDIRTEMATMRERWRLLLGLFGVLVPLCSLAVSIVALLG